MLQGMRGLANSFIFKILFAILILSFVIWGVGDIFNATTKGTPVAEIGKTKVSQQELAASFENKLRALQAQYPSVTRDLAIKMQLPHTQMQEIVQQSLINEEASHMGLVISDEQLIESIKNISVFQDNAGNFDPIYYRSYLQNTGLTERMFLDRLRQDMAKMQLLQFMDRTPALPEKIIEDIYSYRHEKRTAQEIFIPSEEQISAVTMPTEEEVSKFYQDHLAQYKAPEYRNFVVATISPSNLLGKVTASEDEVKAHFEERKSAFAIKPSRDLEIIQANTEEDAEKISTAIAAGRSLEDAATENNGNYIARKNATRTSLPFADLVEPAFTLKEGETTQPLKLALGWFIVKASNVTESKEASFDDYKDQMEEEILEKKANDLLYDETTAIDDYIGEGNTIEETAEKFGMTLYTVDAASDTGQDQNGSVALTSPIATNILESVFAEDAEIGLPSLLEETDQQIYYVFRLNKIIDSAPRPLEQVKDEIRNRIIATKSAEAARTKATEIADKINAGTSIQAVAQEYGLKIAETGDITRQAGQLTPNGNEILPTAVIKDLFATQEIGHAVTGQNNKGAFVAILTGIKQVTLSEENDGLKNLKSQLTKQGGEDLMKQYLDSLRQAYPVHVNNALVTQMFPLSDDAQSE